MHIILYWQRLAGSLLFFSKAPFYSHYQQCVMSSMAVDINLDSSFFIISLHAIVAKSKAKPNKLHTRAHTNTTYCCTYLRTTNWIVLFFSQDYVVFIFLTHAQQYIEWCCTWRKCLFNVSYQTHNLRTNVCIWLCTPHSEPSVEKQRNLFLGVTVNYWGTITLLLNGTIW